MMCFRDLSVVIFGGSFKAFGLRLCWYLSGSLVEMDMLQEKLIMAFEEKIFCLI